MDAPVTRPLVGASEGSHIILPSYLCPPNMGILLRPILCFANILSRFH